MNWAHFDIQFPTFEFGNSISTPLSTKYSQKPNKVFLSLP